VEQVKVEFRMKYRRQTLAHRATDAGPCVCRLTLAAQCCSVMARASNAAMLERVVSGVCSAACLGFNGRRAASVAEATDASVAFGRARGGSDRRSAASVGRPTDTSVVFERGVERTGPRLSVRCVTLGHVGATDACPRSVGRICC
jgi:hypothetical protein